MSGEVVDVGSRAVGSACKGRPRIDSAARVELRLCFGAVLCCVASLRMRRIFSCPKSSLSSVRLCVSGSVHVPVELRLRVRYHADMRVPHVRRKSNGTWDYWMGRDKESEPQKDFEF